jgi:acyl carrier protein
MYGKVKNQLVEFVCKNYMVTENEIDFDQSLVDQGIIDSFGLVEMSAFIQDVFDIKIEESDFTQKNFGSINKISSYVERRLKG